MIRIGVSGNIADDTFSSIKKIKKLGLDSQELAFVRQVYLSDEDSDKLGKLAKELDITLSIHASYYINLSSVEVAKVNASKDRILLASKRAHLMGKNVPVVFHPGYYGKMDKEDTYNIIKKNILDMSIVSKNNGWTSLICPETTGKKSQFGSISELFRLKRETGCSLCIDFSHILARDGRIDYKNVVIQLPKKVHCHFSGIEYSEKGERRHLPIDENEFRKLVISLKKHDIDANIICESPNTLEDALKMKRICKEIGF